MHLSPGSCFESNYRNVRWDRKSRRWRANFQYNKKDLWIGKFETDFEAAVAVNEKCKELGIELRNPEVLGKKREVTKNAV